MSSWLTLFLAPHTVGRENPRRPIALVLEGRFWEYQHEAAERGWPPLGEIATQRGSIEFALLRGLIQHFVTGEDPLPQYRRVATSRRSPATLKTIASILQGIALADDGRQTDAVQILLERDTQLRPGLERALLRLHLATRYAELGEMARALAVNDSAISILRKVSRPAETAKALRLVANANGWRYSIQLRHVATPPAPLSESAWLSRIDAWRADGLQRSLFDQFEGAVKDATQYTISFQSEDPAEASLRRALLRGECFAAWDALSNVRRELGRYRLLSLVAASFRQPESGFHMLRRAGDEEGMRRAARLYLQLGPLGPLSRVGAEFVGLKTWPPAELRSIAALIAVAAQVLDSEIVSTALSRVTALLRDTDTLRIGWAVTDAIVVAAANLVQFASAREQTELARGILELVERPHLEPLISHLRDCLRLINWDELDPDVHEQWIRTAIRLIEDPTNRPIGLMACLALAKSDSRCAEALLTEFRQNSTLEVGATLLEAGIALTDADGIRLARACEARMSDIRNAAQVRQFTLYTVDPPLILAVLSTSRTSQPESWDALVAFLTDSSVPVEVKASTFELLAERIQTMPPPVLPALGPTALEILSNDRVEPSMFGSPVAARGAVLRFALAAGIVSNSDALTQLLGLASDPDPRGRIEAADSLKRAIGVKPDLAVITLAVSLTQDQHHQVRAAAGRALAELSWVNAGPLRGVVRERIRALLTEKGAAVPRATAEGIFQAAKTGTSPDPAVLVTLRAIARNHVAASVRIASSRALEEIG